MKTIFQTIALVILFLSSTAYAQRCRPNDAREWCKELNRRGEAVNSAAFAEALRQAAEQQRTEAEKNRQIRRQKEAAEAIRLNEIRAEQPPARDIWFLNPYIKRDWRVWDGVYLKDLTPKEVFIALTNAERDFELEGIGIPENDEYYHSSLKNLRDELAQDFKDTYTFHRSSLVVKTQSGYSMRYRNANHDRYDFLIDLERIKEGVYYVKNEEYFKLNDELNLNSILRVPYYICDLEDEKYNLNLTYSKEYRDRLVEKHDDFRGCRFALNIKEGEDITQYSVPWHYV